MGCDDDGDVAGRKRSDCDLMLVQGVASEETVPLGAWRKIWEGTRQGDKVERYRLYALDGAAPTR